MQALRGKEIATNRQKRDVGTRHTCHVEDLHEDPRYGAEEAIIGCGVTQVVFSLVRSKDQSRLRLGQP